MEVLTLREKISKNVTTRKKLKRVTGYFYLLPLGMIFMLFTAIPIFSTVFYYGFTEYNILDSVQWVGLKNYIRFFTDSKTPTIIWNTIRFPLMLIPVHVAGALLLALLAHSCRSKIMKYSIRTAVYFPSLVTTASIVIAWGYMFNKDAGVINWLMKEFGLINKGIGWLTSSEYAMWAIVIFSGWKFIGQYFLYYLVGLNNIPESFYEAARIDGANSFQMFRKITLPLLSPTIFMVLLITMVGAMQAFDEPYFLTGGGPGISTTTASLYIYRQAFDSYNMGYASAIATCLFVLVFVLTAIQMKLQSKWVVYDYE